MVFIAIFFVIIILGGIVAAAYTIKEASLFKRDEHNPYRRFCKKCGACQIQYGSNIVGQEDITWWQEVYPIGNDEQCKCHKYAEFHS